MTCDDKCKWDIHRDKELEVIIAHEIKRDIHLMRLEDTFNPAKFYAYLRCELGMPFPIAYSLSRRYEQLYKETIFEYSRCPRVDK